MGLSAREQQALHSIEGGLATSAPRLASRLAAFTRLTAGEAFPVRERIRDRWCVRERWFRGGFGRSLAWPALWLVITAALIAVGLAVGHASGGTRACRGLAPACAWHTGGSAPPWRATQRVRSGS